MANSWNLKLLKDSYNWNLQRTDYGQVLDVHKLFLDCQEIKLTSSYFHHSSSNHHDYLELIQGKKGLSHNFDCTYANKLCSYEKSLFIFNHFLFARDMIWQYSYSVLI